MQKVVISRYALGNAERTRRANASQSHVYRWMNAQSLRQENMYTTCCPARAWRFKCRADVVGHISGLGLGALRSSVAYCCDIEHSITPTTKNSSMPKNYEENCKNPSTRKDLGTHRTLPESSKEDSSEAAKTTRTTFMTADVYDYPSNRTLS